MHIAVGSMFRNSEGYIGRYVAQFNALVQAAPQHTFEPILAEGDSTDRSWEMLNDAFPGHVIKREHGGRWFGVSGPDWHTSADDPQCMSQVSFVCNGVLEMVKPDHDVLLWVESDIIWQPSTMLALISWLKNPNWEPVTEYTTGTVMWEGVDAVAPLCIGNELWHFRVHPLLNARGRHPYCNCKDPSAVHLYDWWGLEAEGRKFQVCPPFHPMLEKEASLYPMDTVGSCLVMRGNVARECRYDPPERGMSGFCENIRSHGYKIWLDPKLKVRHP